MNLLALYRQLADSLPDQLAIVDKNYRYLLVNEAYARRHGRAPAAIEGQRVDELFSREPFETSIKPRMDRCLAGQVVRYSAWLDLSGAGKRFLSVVYTPYRLEDGTVAGAIVRARDATEQQLSDEALQASEANYRSLFENMLHGYTYCRMLFDGDVPVDFIYLLVNPAFEALTGLREVAGRKATEVIPGLRASNPELIEACGRVASTGRREKFETFLQTLGRWFSVSAFSPGPGHFVAIFDNVTEAKEAQRALRAEQERFQLLLESMAEGVYGLDREGVCTFVNPAALRMLGYERAEEVTGRAIHALVHHHHADGTVYPDAACRAYKAYREDRGVHVDDEVYWRRDGTAFPVEYWSYPMHVAGEVVGSVVTFLDISERRRIQERLFEASQMLKLVIDSVPHFVFWKDRRGRYLGANQAFARLVGLDDPDGLVGRDDREVGWRADSPSQQADDEEVMASGTARRAVVEPVDLGDSGLHWLETSKEPLRDARGGVIGVLGVFQDVTERIRSEEKLRQAAKVFESTTEGVLITDLHANIVAVNQAFSQITGYPEQEVLGRNPRMLKSSRHEDGFYQAMWDAIEATGHWQGELWNRRKSGELYPEWLTINTVKDQTGRPINYVGVFSDISAVKQAEAKLNFLAHHDPLTGLPNRLLFNDRLGHAIQRARRAGLRLALLFVDLDQFKHVNDSLGHPVGDQLLCRVAEVLSSSVRAEDTVARLGGDEFVVLLEGIADNAFASDVARKVLGALVQPHELGGHSLVIGASIGISTYPGDGQDAATLLRNADAAMYQAKGEGRNTFRYYSAELTRAARERLTLEGELRRAIERQEFELHYQPQVDVPHGAITGAEALVRWRHPQKGEIPPMKFIPIAEETRLIVPLGEWVLRNACGQYAAWQRQGLPPFTLAVNLSPRQFRAKGLVRLVGDILADTGMPADRLELEITEGAIMERGETAQATLAGLKSLGVGLAIDDFGTGYSSLAYLRRFPINLLKIDQSFMRDIPDDSGALEIAATIIAMAHSLNMKVLAEGVERGDQLAFLLAYSCDYAQGFLHSRPLDAEAFAALVLATPTLNT